MSAPLVKGWCPGAHRPMQSGDGLIVRIRPKIARLDRRQALGLCKLARQLGNGLIDLTNRANLQIRGVRQVDHDRLLQNLAKLDLLDSDASLESRRNVLVTPFWNIGDTTECLARSILEFLPKLPELPAKVGIAVDTGSAPLLRGSSADFRFERVANGLLLRADGSAYGRLVNQETALVALAELVDWFDARRTDQMRRMSAVVAKHKLPNAWTRVSPTAPGVLPEPGLHEKGVLLGAAFGQIDAAHLETSVRESRADGLRVTPWRLFLLEGASDDNVLPFITSAGDPLLRAHACAGVGHCSHATVATRPVAEQLAGRIGGVLHVSGCEKGCALPKAADVTLVGRDGGFDLVEKGAPWDEPVRFGVEPDDLRDRSEQA